MRVAFEKRYEPALITGFWRSPLAMAASLLTVFGEVETEFEVVIDLVVVAFGNCLNSLRRLVFYT